MLALEAGGPRHPATTRPDQSESVTGNRLQDFAHGLHGARRLPAAFATDPRRRAERETKAPDRQLTDEKLFEQQHLDGKSQLEQAEKNTTARLHDALCQRPGEHMEAVLDVLVEAAPVGSCEAPTNKRYEQRVFAA